MQEDKSLPANGMYSRVITPTLEVYLPEKEKASGTVIILCSGGGYSVIVYQGEAWLHLPAKGVDGSVTAMDEG